MSRELPEWIGKTDDQAIPPRVRLRIFERFGGTCAVCSRRLVVGKWDIDHAVSLINGGQHREANMQPVCNDPCHKNKTRQDVKEKATVSRKAMMNIGIKPARKKIHSRGFPKADKQHSASRPLRERT